MPAGLGTVCMLHLYFVHFKGSSGHFKRHCGSQWFAKRILAMLDLPLDQYCMGPIMIHIMNITVF